MWLDGENLMFKVNEEDLGVVFTNPKFRSEKLLATVFITDIADSVQVLRGAIIKIGNP